jgi:hypothetical protein
VPPGDQVTVPLEDGVWLDQQPQAPQRRSWQRLEQRGQPGSLGWFEPDLLPVEVALQYRELVP